MSNLKAAAVQKAADDRVAVAKSSVEENASRLGMKIGTTGPPGGDVSPEYALTPAEVTTAMGGVNSVPAGSLPKPIFFDKRIHP